MNNANNSASRAFAATRTLCLVVLCFTAGCLSRPALHQQTLGFDRPADSVAKTTARTQRVVDIRSVRVAAPFDDRALVYRVGEFCYEADPYAGFLVSPADSLREPIASWMRQSDLFQDVVERGSAVKPNAMVEITAVELYGDFRPEQKAAAVLTLRFVLLDSAEGIPGPVFFEHEYSRRVPLNERNANALMAGWNEALNQILTELNRDLCRVNAPPGH